MRILKNIYVNLGVNIIYMMYIYYLYILTLDLCYIYISTLYFNKLILLNDVNLYTFFGIFYLLNSNPSLILLVFWPHSVFGQNHLCVKML
jgi:hypothetical protein